MEKSSRTLMWWAGRTVGKVLKVAPAAHARDELIGFRCERVGCGAENPSSAVFCRRCGQRARGSPVFHGSVVEDKSEKKRV